MLIAYCIKHSVDFIQFLNYVHPLARKVTGLGSLSLLEELNLRRNRIRSTQVLLILDLGNSDVWGMQCCFLNWFLSMTIRHFRNNTAKTLHPPNIWITEVYQWLTNDYPWLYQFNFTVTLYFVYVNRLPLETPIHRID